MNILTFPHFTQVADPMTDRTPPSAFYDSARSLGLELGPRQVALLGTYLEQLLEATQRFNLTSVTDPDAAWIRHILDSLTLTPYLAQAEHVADVGSGGGLPGIPLAIAAPTLSFSLIEATRKKVVFLEEVKNRLHLSNLLIVPGRAEVLGHELAFREKYDLVIGRAVGSLSVFLELAAPLAKLGGNILAMKGRKAEEEVHAAAAALEKLGCRVVTQHRPLDMQESIIVEIAKVASTPDAYPRRPGLPKKRPL